MGDVAGLEITFSIVGGVALLAGLVLCAWRLSMVLRWERRRATVVSFQRKPAHRGSSYVRLVVRFRSEDGEEVAAADDMPWNRYRAGQELSVLLVPDSDPVRVVVPEFLRFWMMSLIFVPFGSAFLYVALVYVPSLPVP